MKINFLVCCILLTTTSLAQNFERLDSLINSLMKQYQLKGIGIVGVENGKTIYINSAGISNPDAEFTDSTRIYIASNTKTFTGMAMAKLAFEKKLSYSDSITKFIPSHYLRCYCYGNACLGQSKIR